jgi:hypothetical protein
MMTPKLLFISGILEQNVVAVHQSLPNHHVVLDSSVAHGFVILANANVF